MAYIKLDTDFNTNAANENGEGLYGIYVFKDQYPNTKVYGGNVALDNSGNTITSWNGASGTQLKFFGSNVWNNSYPNYVVGNFTDYGGNTTHGIALINSTGTFIGGVGVNGFARTGADIQPYRILEGQSTSPFYVGGWFDSYKSQSRQGIVAIQSNLEIYSAFNANIVGVSGDTNVGSLERRDSDGKIFVGGKWQTIGGISQPALGLVHQTTGALDTGFTTHFASGDTVWGITQCWGANYGKLIIVGNFDSYDGNSVGNIVRVNADGSYDSTFNNGGAGFNNEMRGVSIAKYATGIYQDKIYCVGGFSAYNGEDTYNVAELDSDGNLTKAFSINNLGSFQVYFFDVDVNQFNDTVYVASARGVKEEGIYNYQGIAAINATGETTCNCDLLIKVSGLTLNNDWENQRVVVVWDDDNTQETFYRVQRSEDNGQTWSLLGNRPANINWFYDDTAQWRKTYCYRVAAGRCEETAEECTGEYSDVACIEYYAEPWCSLPSGYTLTNCYDCGVSVESGIIVINDFDDIYKWFYDFTLYNSFGYFNDGNWGSNPTPTGVWSNLPMGWYFIEATPKTTLLTDTCRKTWIRIYVQEGHGSITYLSGETLTHVICGSFDQQQGRAILDVIHNAGDVPYSYDVWKADETLWESGTTSNPLVLECLEAGTYYYLTNPDDGQCLYPDSFTINSQALYSIGNIQEIYVAEWSENLDWNYWSTENDPDYYGGIDTLKFQSTKIKEFLNAGQWYSIEVNYPQVSFNQALAKDRRGITFNDTLSIGIPFHDSDKFNTLTTVLKEKYVVVFKDGNGGIWTFGFDYGATTDSYKWTTEDGTFVFNFNSPSVGGIITALDEVYFNDTIKA